MPRSVREKAKAFSQQVNTYNELYFKKLYETGKALRKQLREDSRKLAEDMIENGKKYAPKIPGAQKMEARITDSFRSAISRLDLPGKKDIERLTNAIDALNRRMDRMDKKIE